MELYHQPGTSLLSHYTLTYPINLQYLFMYLSFYHSSVCNYCFRQHLVIDVSNRKALFHVMFGKLLQLICFRYIAIPESQIRF
jgi:hypothetical protein